MRALVLLLTTTLLLCCAPVHVYAQSPAPHTESQDEHDHGHDHGVPGDEHVEDDKQLPVEVYYNRQYFSEPWRTPQESAVSMVRQTGGVFVVACALAGGLAWRRRKGART